MEEKEVLDFQILRGKQLKKSLGKKGPSPPGETACHLLVTAATAALRVLEGNVILFFCILCLMEGECGTTTHAPD